MAKRLRSGYTTGACAAAAAKAAALFLKEGKAPARVEIPFPDGARHGFAVQRAEAVNNGFFASIIKDAGDDPDVTNGAEIGAWVCSVNDDEKYENCIDLGDILLCGGAGVGRATKPGLAVKVGEPAINPIPRQMIMAAVAEAGLTGKLQVMISVTNGRELADKTLNKRLGILGGLSILGTTGIVRPISAAAWTATITASMDVAKEAGLAEIILSTGRTSEKGVMALLDLPEEAGAMMGDYLHFALQEAAAHKFKIIHLAGMWAKITKAALKVPQTHVRNGALEMVDAADLLSQLGVDGDLLKMIQKANTAREMYEHLHKAGRGDIIKAVCAKARDYASEVSGAEVRVYLVNHKCKVVEYV